MHKEWRRSGPGCQRKLAQTNPEVFVKVVATILPRVIEHDAKVLIEERSELAIKIQDFREAYKLVGAQPPLIDAQPLYKDEDSDEHSH
jgi:hypothetical protein